MSETATLASALADLQTQLPRVTKDQTAGGTFTYNYADLAQVSAELLPIMGKLGLSFSAKPTLNGAGKMVLAYTLRHVGGEEDGGEYLLPDRGSPQDMGSAITYARRYTLCAMSGLAPDNDDDAAAATKAATRRTSRPERAQQADDGGPTGITGDQQRKMQALFTQMGLTDKADKLKYAREVIERDIGSATELTKVEASKVIAKLTSWAAQETPPPKDGA
jgi:hypothetical protein